MDINTHTIQGRLGEDPKVHRTDRGCIARLRVATNYRFKSPSGDWAAKTTWHTVIVRGADVDLVSGARKGDGIFVTGFPEDHEFTDGNGVKRSQRQLIATTVSRPLQVMAPTQASAHSRLEAPYEAPRQPPSQGYREPAEPVVNEGRDRGYREPQPRQPYQRPSSNPAPAQRSNPPRRDPVQAPVAPAQNRSPGYSELPPVDEFADLDSQIAGESYGSGH